MSFFLKGRISFLFINGGITHLFVLDGMQTKVYGGLWEPLLTFNFLCAKLGPDFSPGTPTFPPFHSI